MSKFVFEAATTIDGSRIDGLYVITPMLFNDNRGYFMETYNYREFAKYGLNMNFVQDNQSKSVQGVLRGLHFQKNNPQGKLVRVLEGEVFDVAVDLRSKSDTFGKWYGVKLSADNNKQFYVSEGFAHGFLVLTELAIFSYKCTRFYDPTDECGLIWNDSDINIKWPTTDGLKINLSQKDKDNPFLRELKFSY